MALAYALASVNGDGMTVQQLRTDARLASQRVAAHGRLAVTAHGGVTRLARLYQEGAAKIRLPKSGESGLEAVLINTAGGLTGGDRLRWDVDIGDGARLTVTTQACERAYKSAGGRAEVSAQVSVGANAALAWLPQETILYDRSSLARNLEVNLATGARALILEPVIFGRHAHGETVNLAHFRDRWRVRIDGRLIHAEEFLIGPAVARQLERQVFAGGGGAMATVLLLADEAAALLDPLRVILGDDGSASVWSIGGTGKLLARLIAQDGYALRRRLVPALKLLNGQARLPKLWSL